VIVVGGGDSAVREALYLKNIGCEVTLIHRREKLRAERYLQKNLKEAGIQILWNSVIKEIKGDNAVRSVARYDKKSGEEDVLPVEGIFISIGEDPVNRLATQITGGVRQIVVACAEGAIAATSAYNDLLENKSKGINKDKEFTAG
jgi:thioredoxin reductase (NADPH)